MPRLSAVVTVSPQTVATATLTVETPGEGFTDISEEARGFLAQAQAQDGALLVYVRHTSASLTIQENADPDVRTDLRTADDMPAHIKSMLTGVSLHIPVARGSLGLGTWQGLYLIEHRSQPHRREVVFQFVGGRKL
jgi:thiamine phosphate synthase YjbQ (UPF0047 family)